MKFEMSVIIFYDVITLKIVENMILRYCGYINVIYGAVRLLLDRPANTDRASICTLQA